MRDDFAAFILTHGRPDTIKTDRVLRRRGYTGRIYYVLDDEDATYARHVEKFGEERVLTFSKAEIAARFDEADNFRDRRTIFYARNACWDIARRLGLRYFIQLDDDYGAWSYRWVGRIPPDAEPDYHGFTIRNLDRVFEAFVRFLEATPARTIAASQGGDHIGGKASRNSHVRLLRKAMNTFVCDVERPISFLGRVNEDVNTYVRQGGLGELFFTFTPIQIDQDDTQTNEGGMSAVYVESGTYVKSFYTILYAPSCTSIRLMGESSRRLHHAIRWDRAAPKILHERHRKPRARMDSTEGEPE